MIRKNKKEHLHSPNLRNKSVFRDPIFFSIVVYTFIRSHHLQHLNFNKLTKKKKEKKLKIGFVFLFSPKNYCPNCILLVHSHQNEANYCHLETYLCKYFSFVYWFLASADYDFFPTVGAFHLNPFDTIKRNIVIAILRRHRIQILIK